MQEKSQSEEEHFESADSEDSEDEVESDLKPKTESSNEKESSDGHSRRSSIHSSNEKSKEGSSHSDESDHGPESDSDDPFKESEPVPEPGPSLPQRSSRVPKPLIKYGSAYGNKPTIQIERELKSDKARQKAVEPKAKAMIKQAHNTFHNDLETLKEGGYKLLYYLLAQAVDIQKNPRELQYRNIL